MDSSISTNQPSILRLSLQAIVASWIAKAREHLIAQGVGGYFLLWIVLPVGQLFMLGLIYRAHNPSLVRYAVVGVAASTFIASSQYYVGQILDEERMRGTLYNLFLAPCPRISWLTGFALLGFVETCITAAITVAFGVIVFGVTFDPNVPALLLSAFLFLASLWGLGFIFSAVGLMLKRSNDLSNLLSPVILLLGGIYYPIALLPIWLRLPAHALPFGYGVQAMVDAATRHASITQLGDLLFPSAGFAIALPIAGTLTFRWLERRIRIQGQLDLY